MCNPTSPIMLDQAAVTDPTTTNRAQINSLHCSSEMVSSTSSQAFGSSLPPFFVPQKKQPQHQEPWNPTPLGSGFMMITRPIKTVSSQGMLLPLVNLSEPGSTLDQTKDQLQECVNIFREAMCDPQLAAMGQLSPTEGKGFISQAYRFPPLREQTTSEIPTLKGKIAGKPFLPEDQPKHWSQVGRHAKSEYATDINMSNPSPTSTILLNRDHDCNREEGTKTMVHRAECGKIKKTCFKHLDRNATIVADCPPHQFLLGILTQRGYSAQSFASEEVGYHVEPTPLQLASFGTVVLKALHAKDASALSDLLSVGLSPNPCNRFGDSLLSLVCKRTDHEILQVLINHGCDLQVCDSFGRTPLHNVAWATTFSKAMVKAILDCDLNQLLVHDKQGQCPLEYVRKSQWEFWNCFLKEAADRYWPLSRSSKNVGTWPKDSRPGNTLPDPAGSVPAEVAFMVSDGSMTPDQVRNLDAATLKTYGNSVPVPKYEPFKNFRRQHPAATKPCTK
mmetsp:Transcript_40847/g.57442  ORF Transcript_40847/g.57442 Transcript_40847/m.57442 type:complete len:504 (+) Transcript_40847:36-1547(+)